MFTTRQFLHLPLMHLDLKRIYASCHLWTLQERMSFDNFWVSLLTNDCLKHGDVLWHCINLIPGMKPIYTYLLTISFTAIDLPSKKPLTLYSVKVSLDLPIHHGQLQRSLHPKRMDLCDPSSTNAAKRQLPFLTATQYQRYALFSK